MPWSIKVQLKHYAVEYELKKMKTVIEEGGSIIKG